MAYCIDTSSLIAAWDERYPIAHFAKFWNLLEQSLHDGSITISFAVLDELEKKSADLLDWIQNVGAGIILPDEQTQREVSAILTKHQRLVMEKKQRYAADPFVIATAKIQKRTVITEENPTGNLLKPNIPDVCADYGIICINLIRLIRTENWIIG